MRNCAGLVACSIGLPRAGCRTFLAQRGAVSARPALADLGPGIRKIV
jgi:hypothetical protein